MKMNNQDRKQWIVIGVLIILVACFAGIMIFGGGAAFLALRDKDTTPKATEQVNEPPPDNTGVQDPTQVPETSDNNLIPFEAVVQIFAYYLEDGDYYVGWTGSGTIISADGLILTNAHVVLPDKYFPVDALSIALTVEEDQLPDERYLAEVMQADEALDLAVLQITSDLNWNPINKSDLNLPFVPQGNADALSLGDAITILGYPGIGGDTITLTAGEVSGFTQETGYGDRAFIKTNATIAGGNSGGLAVDSSGRLIGVPTQLGYGGDGQFVDCRVLADTNRDGVINDNDSCVPTGGFINALRPINLAIPLIEAAQNGEINIQRITSNNVAVEAPESSNVLFEDYFDPPAAGWVEWETDISKVEFVNGDMQISLFEEDYFAWNNPELWFTDVIISTFVHIEEPGEDAAFGVICRYQDEDNFYGLEVSEDGYFVIWKYVAGEYENLYGWEETDLIPSTGTFEISASCIGNELALAVDGYILGSVIDDSFSEGDVGIVVDAWEVPGFTISFEAFLVYSPE